MMYDYGYGFYSPFHFLFGAIGWLIVIMLIIWVVRAARGKGHHHHPFGVDSAMDTLRNRYAKGEISKEEFEERKKHLML